MKIYFRAQRYCFFLTYAKFLGIFLQKLVEKHISLNAKIKISTKNDNLLLHYCNKITTFAT